MIRLPRPTAAPFLLAALLAAGCGGEAAPSATAGWSPPEAVRSALDAIDPDDLVRRIQMLASDEFEGRAPATRGEELTVDYLTAQLRLAGLQPGNPDGSYVQEVPLVGFTPEATTASFSVDGRPMPLEGPGDFLAVTRRVVPEVRVQDSDVVFVGYGVVAPEYDWDDFGDVDVRGKTIVMLVNDPPVPHPRDPARLDPDVFNGEAMTYYGRWTYKYEIAADKGAAAAIVVHETGPAGYPFEVLQAGWGRESFDVQSPDGNMGRVAVEAWIPEPTARRLFEAAGHDFDQLKQAAVSRDFRPVPLEATASFHIRNRIREVRSRNVVARLEGSDPELRHEHVIYTAHWDHLGKDESLEGDQIFNGALDNASGTAGLVSVAEAFAALETPPARSVLFLAVTAEEMGLLGAKWYGQSPLYPLERTLANINMDGLNQWGRTRDIVVVGLGNSTLDDVLDEVAAGQGRRVEPDPEPEKGFFYRSDHFEFAKQGIPALYTDSGTDFVGRPEGWGEMKRQEYTANDYHKPSDEIKADWDLAGAVEDLRLLFLVGWRVANEDPWPEWKPGTEFRAAREEMLGRAAAP